MTYQQLSLLLVVALGTVLYFYQQKRKAMITVQRTLADIEERYKPAIDLDDLIREKEELLVNLDNKQKMAEENAKDDLAALLEDYQKKKVIYDRLKAELALIEERHEMVEYGLYEPHFDFDTSTKYKIELGKLRDRQKAMIKNKEATHSYTDWTVSGSKAKGQQMVNRQIRLMLRAFNGECDAAIGNVRWNNVNRIATRIEKSCEAINKLGETQSIEISAQYLQAKLDELHLAHEYEEKRYEEKEEQRRIREERREEERAQKELEKAQRYAEKEERRYEEALERARQEIAHAQGAKLGQLNDQIAQLEAQLQAAHEARERAKSRAEMTKSGHVYIISNIGSFGEQIFKIGMTRRLEPLDRVRELGDASVPFLFDLHAMIYSNNAPELENQLHQAFRERRVNLANNRKEFFKVSLEEIEAEVKKSYGDIEFIRFPEAKEYRETLALLEENGQDSEAENQKDDEFPASLA